MRENDLRAVLDSCVLVPMALCDLLLRLAEEPALYLPQWSEEILAEVGRSLRRDLGRTPEQIAWRLAQMRRAFPEAMVDYPKELLQAAECIPDPDDRHVLAAAICCHADVIVTQNVKHFPADCLSKFKVTCETPDEFLIGHYHIAGELVLSKLDDQATGIGKDRAFVISSLKQAAPRFCHLLERR